MFFDSGFTRFIFVFHLIISAWFLDVCSYWLWTFFSDVLSLELLFLSLAKLVQKCKRVI